MDVEKRCDETALTGIPDGEAPDHSTVEASEGCITKGLHQLQIAVDSPMAKTEPPRGNEYFMVGDGIDAAVIAADICRYLGNDALVRPGTYTDPRLGGLRDGYFIEASRHLTADMVLGLRRDSARRTKHVRWNRQLVKGTDVDVCNWGSGPEPYSGGLETGGHVRHTGNNVPRSDEGKGPIPGGMGSNLGPAASRKPSELYLGHKPVKYIASEGPRS